MFRKNKKKGNVQDAAVTIPNNNEIWYKQGQASAAPYTDSDEDTDIPIGLLGEMALAGGPGGDSGPRRTRPSFSMKRMEPTRVPHTPEEFCSVVGNMDWATATRFISEDPQCVSQQADMTLKGQPTRGYPVHLLVTCNPPPEFLERVVRQYPGALLSGDSSMSRTPLHWACIVNANTQILQILSMANPAACKQQDRSHSRTPLHYLVLHASDPNQVRVLMEAEHRATMTRDRNNQKPIDLAESSNNPFKLDILPVLQDIYAGTTKRYGGRSGRSKSPGKYNNNRGTSPGKYGGRRSRSPGKFSRGTSPGRYATVVDDAGERGPRRTNRIERPVAPEIVVGNPSSSYQVPPPPRTIPQDEYIRLSQKTEGGSGPIDNNNHNSSNSSQIGANLENDLNDSIEKLKRDKASRRVEMEQKDLEISQIDRQLSDISRQENRLTMEMRQTHSSTVNQEAIYEKEERISHIQRQIADLRAELRQLEGEVRSLQNNPSSSVYEISRMESKLRSLKDEKMTFQAIREALNEERNTVKRDFENLDDEIKSLEAIQSMAMNNQF